MLKIISVIGARPQFIKVAPISKAIRQFNRSKKSRYRIREVIIHTGQHYDYNMNDIFFKEMGLQLPNYNLGVGSHSQGKQIAMMVERLETVLRKETPDLVLVYGDTNSTLAGALAAKKLNILVAHVEAGLRSYNMDMPEELNRVVVDRISDMLFCPSKTAVENLSLEGIRNCATKRFPRIFLVGDVMYDSILFYLGIAIKRSKVLNRLSLLRKSYYLATIHRAENTDNLKNLKCLLRTLNEVAKNVAPVIFPIHPRTEKALGSARIVPSEYLKIIKPVSYLDMLMLEKNAKAVLTDSGGVQKEACFLKVPCITLRRETEWKETVDAGFNILTGCSKDKVISAIDRINKLDIRFFQLYGNGKAGRKIIDILSSNFN